MIEHLRGWLGAAKPRQGGSVFNTVPQVASLSTVPNHNESAIDLYRRLRAGSNLVFSPFSIRMTYVCHRRADGPASSRS